MTPVFCCGFECGGSGHWSLTGTSSISDVSPITGSRSLLCNPTNATGYAKSAMTFDTGVIVGRCNILVTSFPSAPKLIVSFIDTIGNLGSRGVYLSQSGYISTIGSNTVGIKLSLGVTYRLDFKIQTLNLDWIIDCKVNGESVESDAVSLSAKLSTYLSLGFTTNSTAEMRFDDVVVSTTGADYPIGAGYVNHFVPTSDGTHNIAGTGDFKHGEAGTDILNATTDAYTLVDEVPLPSGTPSTTDLISAIAPPNATDYVECVFGPAAGISTPTAGPRAVECVFAAHQAGTQSGSYKVNLNDNGSVGLVFEQAGVAGATSFQYKTKQFPTAPSTSGAWGVTSGNANFNNVRFRFYSADAAPDQYLDAIMIEAEFASPAAAFMPRPNSPILQGIKRASFW